jgi:hypothetical protein
VADSPRRYKALAHIIVGGRLLFAKDSEFETSEAFGDALVKEGRAVLLPAMIRRTHKRRDMRAEGEA